MARLAPFERAVEFLKTIPGVGESTAEVIVAETGADMSRFATAGHLAAWAGVAPADHESAGKRRPVGARHGDTWLRRALVESAKAASRQKETYLGVQSAKSLPGVARTKPPSRSPLDPRRRLAHAQNRHPVSGSRSGLSLETQDPEVEKNRLIARLESLGLEVTVSPAA